MSQAIQCDSCGRAIPADAKTMGLCPHCLIARVKHEQTTRKTRQHIQQLKLPDAKTLAEAFPDLEIISILGRGGSGAVYKARHRRMDGMVAVKILMVDPAEDSSAAQRFASEARILESLDHPHIVRAYGAGTTGRFMYTIMELVEGPSLRQVIGYGALRPQVALTIAMHMCNGLAYAHSRGIMHRDIKPENVLLHPGAVAANRALTGFFEGGARARLADFGLARSIQNAEQGISLTLPNYRVGTLDYMAPECRNGTQRADARADIYAIGVVLYEMLTGELPIGLFQRLSHRCEVGGQVDEIVRGCLQSDPAIRYISASAIWADLRKIVGVGAAS